jgi:hypothetical protein
MTARGQKTDDILPKGQGCFSFPAPPHPPWVPPRLLSVVYIWLCRLDHNDWSVEPTAHHRLVLNTKRLSSELRHSSLRVVSLPRSLNLYTWPYSHSKPPVPQSVERQSYGMGDRNHNSIRAKQEIYTFTPAPQTQQASYPMVSGGGEASSKDEKRRGVNLVPRLRMSGVFVPGQL